MKMLQSNLIRLHIVANSDSEEDQSVKLAVRDAVISYLQPMMQTVRDKGEMEAYLRNNMDTLRRIAEEAVHRCGKEYGVSLALASESFGKRIYDTFSLPSGIYDSLRIQLGEADGHNWWCVGFPSLCLPESVETFSEIAKNGNISDRVTRTLAGETPYEIHFFFMDCFGKIEKIFH